MTLEIEMSNSVNLSLARVVSRDGRVHGQGAVCPQGWGLDPQCPETCGGRWTLYEPDPDLIRAATSGDHAAFEELVREYQAHVWRFLRHFLGDPELAKDVTQETFVRVYRKLGTFRFRSKFSTWVFQVARNAGIDELRSRQRRDRLYSKVESEVMIQPPDANLGLELEEALQSLSPKLREAFILIEALGLTYREAGNAMSVPEGTVKSRVFLARDHLVSWMTNEDGMAGDA